MPSKHFWTTKDMDQDLKVREITQDVRAIIAKSGIQIANGRAVPGSRPTLNDSYICFNGVDGEACDGFLYPRRIRKAGQQRTSSTSVRQTQSPTTSSCPQHWSRSSTTRGPTSRSSRTPNSTDQSGMKRTNSTAAPSDEIFPKVSENTNAYKGPNPREDS